MKITVLAGDGIGPEVCEVAVQVLSAIAESFDFSISFDKQLIGGAAIREKNSPFPDETRRSCLESDAVLLGAVGAPEFDDLLPKNRPEIGLLKLRKTLGGYANLRPAKAFSELIDSSPLRREIFEGTDLLIVRELLGGIYFGEPRGFKDDNQEAFNTLRYSVSEIERVAKIAFESAGSRKRKVTSVDKANVLESSRLWRDVVTSVSKNYPNIELEHLYVDACAMHLVTNPRQFDVILTGNLFGDILSDEAAVLTGSLGMLASATIGGKVDLYEPVHGSAPDIAGENIANPLGAIASAAMLMRHTAKNEQAASAIEKAILDILAEGYRTADLTDKNSASVSTSEMSALIIDRVEENADMSHAFHAV